MTDAERERIVEAMARAAYGAECQGLWWEESWDEAGRERRAVYLVEAAVSLAAALPLLAETARREALAWAYHHPQFDYCRAMSDPSVEPESETDFVTRGLAALKGET